MTALLLERLVPAEDAAAPSAPAAEQPAAADAAAAAAPDSGDAGSSLSVVKLGCCGCVLLMLSDSDSAPEQSAGAGSGGSGVSGGGAAREAQRVCSDIIEGIASKRLPRLAHAQRILPILTTCKLQLAALEAAGRRLAPFVAEAAAPEDGSGEGGGERSVSFGIALQEKRGNVEGSGGGGSAAEPAEPSGEAAPGPAPPRGEVLAAIARGLTAALREEHGVAARVDLKQPDVTVVAEKLPLARAGGLLGLAALPRRLCMSDGRKLAVMLVGPAGEQQQQQKKKKKGRGQK